MNHPVSAPVSHDDEFSRLLTDHSRHIFGLIFAIVHSMADAEDVFQQVCIALWERFDRFERGTDFAAWASSIAKSRALNFLRDQRRDRVHFSSELCDYLAAEQSEPSANYESRMRALDYCIHKLSLRDRQTIEKCYQHGVTIKQAAESLGRPLGSVYDSLVRIRRALWTCIENALAEQGGA